MLYVNFNRRKKIVIPLKGLQNDLQVSRETFNQNKIHEAFDIYEQLAASYPSQSVEILAEVYDCYQKLPFKDRYNLYQARLFDFNIKPSDKVLDIGSGHKPFPLATHLADIQIHQNDYGRGGSKFKFIKGKPVFECKLEKTPFEDKEFDFVYCSHVLEHSINPKKACNELMRIGKRGYIETPSKGKDIFLNSAKVSNHRLWVESVNDKLIFTEYTLEEIEGIQNSILMSMHTAPQTKREKAFSALIFLKPSFFNTMFFWEDNFEFEVRSISDKSTSKKNKKSTTINISDKKLFNNTEKQQNKKLKFLQVHTFYKDYLEQFYHNFPKLKIWTFSSQIQALISDGFSGIHIIAPYMEKLNYNSSFIIANNQTSQQQWLNENNLPNINQGNSNWINDVLKKQIELIKPDVLYLTDPILFDSNFIRSLTWKPSLVIGWRAAQIPETIDWSEFDIILSSLSKLREIALNLGASSSEHFFPGFPTHILQKIKDVPIKFDVGFIGRWSLNQHPRRNHFLNHIAISASRVSPPFSCAFNLSGHIDYLTPEVARYNLGPLFGIPMYRSLKSAKVAFDSRGSLQIRNFLNQKQIDLAVNETANMRIFEATGCGVFLLTEHFENLQQYFEIGKEIVTFHNEKDLIEKIQYYILHQDERNEIAHRGQQRCLRDYSMINRAKELDRIIHKYLSKKNISTTFHICPVESLRDKALKLINQSEYQNAFELITKAKSLKKPTLNLDYLRALCFLNMNRSLEAKEALKEELRYFPSNTEAKKLLDYIVKSFSQNSSIKNSDPEFCRIHDMIHPYTMLSEKRLFSLYVLCRHICLLDIKGNFVECGVAAGGSSALIASVIKKFSKRSRKLYSFDTFEGMPEPSPEDILLNGSKAESIGWGTGTCSASKHYVTNFWEKLELSDIITPVKGLFEDTLPGNKDQIGDIAFIHLDGDWYKSTKSILYHLYDNIVNTGILQVDDYGHWAGCKKAIHEFETQQNTNFCINNIDGAGVWFFKKAYQ